MEPSNNSANDTLETLLRERGCLCDDEQDKERRKVLDTLEKILCRWCDSLQREESTKQDDEIGISLITFGSYRLKVHRPGSDLDCLALSPSFCKREDFFNSLTKLLSTYSEIEDIHPIPSAFTPVIKFRLHSVQVDLLFGRVADTAKLLKFQQERRSKPTPTSMDRVEYLIDETDLIKQDEATIRSLNGVRVTQLLLDLVPHQQHFRITLSAVKVNKSLALYDAPITTRTKHCLRCNLPTSKKYRSGQLSTEFIRPCWASWEESTMLFLLLGFVSDIQRSHHPIFCEFSLGRLPRGNGPTPSL